MRLLLFLLLPAIGFGQVSGYSFLPMIAEFTKIYEISENDEIEIPLHGQKRKLKGFKTFAQYDFDVNSKQTYTVAFLMGQFEKAVKPHLKGILLQEETRAIYKLEYEGMSLVAVFEVYNEGLQYSVTILKTGSIKTLEDEVDAEKMYHSLLKDGHISLYINFGSGDSELTEDAIKTVEQIARLMKSNPELRLIIEGHTDNVGTPEKNKKLSLERANSVVKYLIARGISSSRLAAKGMGAEKPIGDNNSEEGRRKNRRVELVKVD